ncbi:MAG: pyruvate kinase [Phycisphaerales bacterium]
MGRVSVALEKPQQPRTPSAPTPMGPTRVSRTRIVATIGPASDSPAMVERLINAGVNIFRFNFSHGTLDDHARRLATVRAVAQRMGRPVGCLGDLQGPKIRVGKIGSGFRPEGPGVELAAGDEVVIDPDATDAAVEALDNAAASNDAHAVAAPDAQPRRLITLPTDYEPIGREVLPGHRVLINDGNIRMLAVEGDDRRLRCSVTVGGLVTSRKGINLPDSRLSAPAITEDDWDCVEFAVNHGLDFLALSFVRNAAEVELLKDRLAGMCPADRSQSESVLGSGTPSYIPVIAKIEKPEALANLDAIVDAADGIMVARGDLGVEMDIAQVPVAQKRILDACDRWGKPSIVATQMLETMIDAATPTRAEASDVANAIFDGAGAVMLSAETATGKHPVLVVETMSRIIQAAEARIDETPMRADPPAVLQERRYFTAALAHGAWHVARDVGAVAVACWSENGGTARYLSQNDFRVPIVAYSSNPRATRRMSLLRGVTPIHAPPPASGRLSDWGDRVEADLLAAGLVRPNDAVVLLAGKPLGRVYSTSTLAVHRIGSPTGGYRTI